MNRKTLTTSCSTSAQTNVAILLATYNGERFVERQIRSLSANATPFTLHWIDDHSSDRTRETVRSVASRCGLEVREWHTSQRLGIPGTFFHLLEHVEADVYLFCDQDDVWQPGKIDVTVDDLRAEVASPVLCFSDPFILPQNEADAHRRISDITRIKGLAALRRSSMFVICPAIGHTIGVTRALRDILLRNLGIARAYAASHDTWMYLIAAASGTARMLSSVPTTLYRIHGANAYGGYFGLLGWRGLLHVVRRWRMHQAIRRWVARQAKGFCLAAPTLPPGPKLDQFTSLARLIATLDRRQSPAALARLMSRGAVPPGLDFGVWFAATCLCSDARVGRKAPHELQVRQSNGT